jgi:very-short-patch-repair endonuclease
VDLPTLFLRQAGVVSRQQALEAGVTRRQVDRLLQSREWLRVHPGVYRLRAVAPSPEASARAAALWLGARATLTGTGAGWWWGLTSEPPICWRFVLPVAHRQARPGVQVSDCYVDPYDQQTRRGLAVVSPPLALLRTAVEVEASRPGAGVALIDRAKQRRELTQRDLEHAYRRHQGTWGSRAMRQLLDHTGDRAHSELERMAVGLLRAAGITGFTLNHRTRLSSGRVVELDIAFQGRRVALELDGYAYHASPEAHRADLRRANEIMADGWTLRRFTYADLANDPEGFVRAVRSLLD